jgi:hypothetical protein
MSERVQKRKVHIAVNLDLADRTGLEPATSAVTGRHSNQLNYRSNLRVENVGTLVFRDGKDRRILTFSNKTMTKLLWKFCFP